MISILTDDKINSTLIYDKSKLARMHALDKMLNRKDGTIFLLTKDELSENMNKTNIIVTNTVSDFINAVTKSKSYHKIIVINETSDFYSNKNLIKFLNTFITDKNSEVIMTISYDSLIRYMHVNNIHDYQLNINGLAQSLKC